MFFQRSGGAPRSSSASTARSDLSLPLRNNPARVPGSQSSADPFCFVDCRPPPRQPLAPASSSGCKPFQPPWKSSPASSGIFGASSSLVYPKQDVLRRPLPGGVAIKSPCKVPPFRGSTAGLLPECALDSPGMSSLSAAGASRSFAEVVQGSPPATEGYFLPCSNGRLVLGTGCPSSFGPDYAPFWPLSSTWSAHSQRRGNFCFGSV
jgi:hypothetical protein